MVNQNLKGEMREKVQLATKFGIIGGGVMGEGEVDPETTAEAGARQHHAAKLAEEISMDRIGPAPAAGGRGGPRRWQRRRDKRYLGSNASSHVPCRS